MRTKCTKILALLMVMLSTWMVAQIQVSGVVKDAEGEPLPGAYVESESGESVETDVDGKYTITANQGEKLTFSFIGMDNMIQTVSGNSLNVVLGLGGGNEIEQVVVTGIGGNRQARALGYAAVKVDGEELTRTANANPFETLSGKIPGVDISSPGQPGASAKVISRGFSSLVGNQPLLVINGSPVSNNRSSSSTGFDNTYDAGTSLNDIDPNTIESMNFLKGAAATALYGKDGANGVIIITTKKGKNKLKVDISSSYDFAQVARLPHIQTEFGQGWAGAAYSNVSGEGSSAASNENGSWGPRFDGQIRPWGRIVNNSQQLKPYVALEDNVEEFFDIGITQTNSISLSGGGENADMAFTYTDVDSDGIFPTDQDSYKKKNYGFNGGLKFDKLKVRVSGNYIHKAQSAVPGGQGDDASYGKTLFQEMLQMPNDISIVDMEDQTNIFNTPSYFFTPYAANPYVTLANNNVRIKKDRFYGNMNLNYMLSEKLTANFQLGADIDTESVKRWGAIVEYVPGSPQDLAGANGVVGGVSEFKRTDRFYDTYGSLNYVTDFGTDFTLNALGGFGYQERNGDSLFASVTDLDLLDFYELSNSASTPNLSQSNYKRRYYYAFGQAELGYKDRYFLTVTGRNDWSSTLGLDNQSFFYPSVSLSAVVLDNANFLKLRGAWAQVGNDAPVYRVNAEAGQAANDGYFGSIAYPFGGVNSYEIFGGIENPDLKAELTSEFEIGMEGRFLNNRVNVDLSFYDRLTTDMLFSRTVPRSTGYSSIFGNYGEIRNKGIELMLDTYPIKGRDFKWNFTYTFAKNDSKVEKLDGVENIVLANPYGIDFRVVEGEDFGTFWAQVPKTNENGEYIVNPDTGFYEVTDEVQKIGSAERDFVMGFINKFSYKNFDLSFGIDWKQGGEMYSYTKRLSYFVGNGIETTYNDRNPFIIPNSVVDNGDGTYSENTTPIAFDKVTNFYNTSNNPGIERDHIIDKTFVRLRDLSLSYSLPKHILGDSGLNNVSFSIYGRNLFLWTPDGNAYVDPEATTYGNDITSEVGEFSANPTQRTYGMGIKLSF